jgi:hypothetical protein
MKTLRDWWREAREEEAPLPYVLIDCAGLEGGRERLPFEAFAELESLFTGDLADEIGDVGGVLARVRGWDDEVMVVVEDLMQRELAVLLSLPQPDPTDPFGVDARGGGSVAAAPTFAQLHRHLRKFNVVYGPEGKPLFWRYYDPRGLPSVLGVMDPAQQRAFLGPFEMAWVMRADGAIQAVCEAAGAPSMR